MAERVVQVPLYETVASRPERPRGRTRRAGRRIWATLTTGGLVAAMGVVTAHYLMIDQSADQVRAASLIPTGAPARALVVLAHPGDEVAMAGTLQQLDAAGAQVSLLSLTKGEAQAPQLAQFSSKRLGKVRADELRRAGEELGVEQVTVAGFADGQLMTADPGAALDTLVKRVVKFRPSVLLVPSPELADDADGAGLLTLAINAAQDPFSTVARVWQVTRSPREVAGINRVAGGVVTNQALPTADVAVSINSAAIAKAAVIEIHGTQNPDLSADYPGVHEIPAAAYFRFFDREYFHLAWGDPLD
ncbi:MAG: PIG-L family deacetylase [Candidatus Nanopelagicales bacterium]